MNSTTTRSMSERAFAAVGWCIAQDHALGLNSRERTHTGLLAVETAGSPGRRVTVDEVTDRYDLSDDPLATWVAMWDTSGQLRARGATLLCVGDPLTGQWTRWSREVIVDPTRQLTPQQRQQLSGLIGVRHPDRSTHVTVSGTFDDWLLLGRWGFETAGRMAAGTTGVDISTPPSSVLPPF